MYYGNPYRSISYKKTNYDGERLIPFAGPFLLGALTGGVAVSAFNPYRPRPYGPGYYPGPMYPGGYYPRPMYPGPFPR